VFRILKYVFTDPDPRIRNSDLRIDSGGNATMPAESASALIFPEHFEAILMSSNEAVNCNICKIFKYQYLHVKFRAMEHYVAASIAFCL
jgi:hypothetical protein